MSDGPRIISADQPHETAEVGGKARALAELAQAGFDVPRWFVVTPRARCADGTLDDAARAAMAEALSELGEDGLYAVRSSGVEEDHADHSFAGQFESYLGVPADRVAQRVEDVWRSGLSERVRAYRREQGLSGEPSPPAVLVQRLIVPEAAGVAFAADPITGRRGVAVVSAVFGVGTALVGGDADADTFHVDRDGRIAHRNLAEKTSAHRIDPGAAEGIRIEALDEATARRPAVSDEQVCEIARLVRAVSRHFHRPQDIEWAVAEGQIWLLQSRPITSLHRLADADAAMTVWDNANIIESYPGVTLPLTYSFARGAYEQVYRQFCRLMGVPAARVRANDDLFANMIGLVQGRVYYNLINWYRLLALLPGYKANRAFMEQMMGVRESLPEQAMPKAEPAGWLARWGDRLALGRSVASMVAQHWRLKRTIRAFHDRLDEALRPGPVALEAMRLDELAAEYHRLESLLLTRWDAPLVNDFFAMIFYGLLRKLTSRYTDDPDLHNSLLCDQGGMISAEPARRIQAMARLAAPHAPLVEQLCTAPPAEVEAALRHVPELERQYRAYLDRFGERCMEELKLETRTLADDPEPLLRSIGHTARRVAGESDQAKPSAPVAGGQDDAQRRLDAALAGRPLRGRLYRWVLRHARARVSDRENLRFERTRVFGRVRRIFVEVGRRLVAEGQLDAPRDVFYLEVNDLLGFIEGTCTCTDLRALVSARKQTYERYHTLPAPPERFTTHGPVPLNTPSAPESPQATDAEPTVERLQGTGCCAGRVSGVARVITDPRGAELHDGEILVAERTDPGWILLFPSAAGVIVERGSLLSHSAIVARELGIPAVVAVAGLLRAVHTGDRIEMDGSTGHIRILAHANPAEAHADAQ